MKISVPKESVDSETRVAVTPYSASELIKSGYEVCIQQCLLAMKVHPFFELESF